MREQKSSQLPVVVVQCSAIIYCIPQKTLHFTKFKSFTNLLSVYEVDLNESRICVNVIIFGGFSQAAMGGNIE